MTPSSLLAVFVGGGLGSLLRYAVSLAVMRTSAQVFPLATLIANVLSCILLGLAIYHFAERVPENSWQRLFLVVGLCGGFSTFSTFSLENHYLMKAGSYAILGLNIVLSLGLCMLVFVLLSKRLGEAT